MKKLLSLVLILALTLGTTATVFAATSTATGKIDGMALGLEAGFSGDTYLGEIAPGDKHVIYIDLTDDMFTWDDGFVSASPAQITSSQIRNGKLTVRASNSKVLESVSINNSKGRIEIEFVKELVSVKEQDFDFDITLSVNGSRQTDYSINFSGTLANPVYEVDANTESEDISDGTVLKAVETVRDIAIDIGSGVTLNTRLTNGRSYYATADYTPTSADEKFMTEHKTVTDVINLKAINFSAPTCTVTLNDAFRSSYVYDADGTYLGRGSDSLEFRTKYYLSTAELTLTSSTSTDDVSKPDTSSDTSAPDTTGTPKAPENSNYNPNTGR